jgi:hypothetical protein
VGAVYLTPDIALANVLSGTFYGLWNLFAGFLIGYAVCPVPYPCLPPLKMQWELLLSHPSSRHMCILYR